MDKKRPRLHYGWFILLVGFLGVVGALGFGRYAYTPILPPMRQALSLTYAQMGWIGTGNFIGFLTFSLVAGFLTTWLGPRRVISASLLCVAVSLVLTGLSNSFAVAFALRTVTGAGSAGVIVPVMAVASAWFASRRRGLATGVLVSGAGLGLLMLGPLIPYILKSFPVWGWRGCWVILGGLTLIIAALSHLFLKNRPEDMNLRPIGGEDSLVFSPGLSSSWKEVYTSPSIWQLAGIFFAFGFSYIIYVQFFSAYLINEMRIGGERAGAYLMLLGILSIFCGPLWGTLSDIIGRRNGIALVLLTQGSSYLLFGLVRSEMGFLASTILFGLTAWAIPSIVNAAVGDSVSPRMAPAALGFTSFICSLGQAFGPPIAGKIADLTGSFGPAFLLSAGITFGGMLGALMMKNVAPQKRGAEKGLKNSCS